MSGRRARVLAVAVPSVVVSTAACACILACCLWRWYVAAPRYLHFQAL